MYAGQKVAYRLVPASQNNGRALIVEAEIVDTRYPPGQDTYNGEPIRGYGPILVHTPDREAKYRRLHTGADLTDWDKFTADNAYHHHVLERLQPGVVAGLVSHVRWYPDSPTGDGHGCFAPDEHETGFYWEKVTIEGFAAGNPHRAIVKTPNGMTANVATVRLYGRRWIYQRERVEARRRETDERIASDVEQIAGLAERLDIDRTLVRCGYDSSLRLAHRGPYLAVTPAQLVGLIERARNDPDWYARLSAEGVVDALS